MLVSFKTIKFFSDYKSYSKFLAVHNVSLQADEPNRVRVPIEQIFKHPNFTELSLFQYIYDVALVKLATPLDIAGNPHLGTICLPPQNDTWNPYQGRLTTVAGWGWTKPLDETSWSEVLLKVAIPVADMEWCKKMSHLEKKGINSKICTYQEHKAVCMVGKTLNCLWIIFLLNYDFCFSTILGLR